jgi:hypothetical protein
MAVTEVFAEIMRLHAPVPLHPPDHPAKVEPLWGVAVSVTFVPLLNIALHAWLQLMPDGELVTVPLPVPLVCSES